MQNQSPFINSESRFWKLNDFRKIGSIVGSHYFDSGQNQSSCDYDNLRLRVPKYRYRTTKTSYPVLRNFDIEQYRITWMTKFQISQNPVLSKILCGIRKFRFWSVSEFWDLGNSVGENIEIDVISGIRVLSKLKKKR